MEIEEDVNEILETAQIVYNRARTKLAKAPHIEGKHAYEEITNNLYPLVISLVQKLKEQDRQII